MTRLYYFSGTGNSLAVARWLKEDLGEAEIYAVTEYDEVDTISVPKGTAVGLVFPLYYYGLPAIINRFIKKLDLSSVRYSFAVITAEVPSGHAVEQLRDRFSEKNSRLNAAWYLPMPTNFVPTRTPPTTKKAEKILGKARLKAGEIARKASQKESFFSRESKLFSLLLNTRSAYKKWIDDPESKDRHLFVSSQCTGCGICVNRCPVNNIEKTADNNAPGISFKSRCEQCLACVNYCPMTAIEYKENRKRNSEGTRRYQYPGKQ